MPKRRKVLIGLGGSIAIAGCTGDTEDEPASFNINEVSSSDNNIREGNSVILRAEIENTGDESGETTVELDINGHQESEPITLEGGEGSTVEFEIDTAEIGSGRYNYTFSLPDSELTDAIIIYSDLQYAEHITEEAVNNASGSIEELISVNVPEELEDGFEVEAEYIAGCLRCDSTEDWLERFDRNAISVFEYIFTSDADIQLARMKTIGETVDSYGNENERHVHTVALNQETASEINWDNFRPDPMQFILIAQEYWWDDSIL